jgi:predicted RNA binding protein YcfA (HicA-like mRNA interferase family)
VPRIPGVNHLEAVRALEKAGFRIIRQGKHIIMSNGVRQVVIPRHNPIKAFTMGGIVQDAGLTVEEFRKLLQALQKRSNTALEPTVLRLSVGVRNCLRTGESRWCLVQGYLPPLHFAVVLLIPGWGSTSELSLGIRIF